MKKVLSVILILVFFSFSSCSNAKILNKVEFNKTNYNNIQDFFTDDFWYDDGNVYYSSDGLYNLRWFCKNSEGTKKLFTEYQFMKLNNCDYGQFNNSLQSYGNIVYTWFSADKENIFYKYDKDNKKLEEIFRVKDRVHLWAVKDEKLIYSVYESEFNIVLYVYDLKTNLNKIIAKELLSFGIVEDSVRYILRFNPSASSNQNVYEYSLKSNEYEPICGCDEFVEMYEQDLVFNFTKNKVVFYSDEAPKDLYVLNTDTSKVNKYSLPHSIQFISCYDEYAFASLYNKDDNSIIAHINLDNGEYKTIRENIDCQLVNAINDNQAFIIAYTNEVIRTKVEYILIDKDGVCDKVI